MNPKEFVRTCVLCGYASKKVAKEYAQQKKRLTADDFIEVYRINERKNDLKHEVLTMKASGDGDYLLDALNHRPIPWKKDIDLNRGLRENFEDIEE